MATVPGALPVPLLPRELKALSTPGFSAGSPCGPLTFSTRTAGRNAEFRALAGHSNPEPALEPTDAQANSRRTLRLFWGSESV